MSHLMLKLETNLFLVHCLILHPDGVALMCWVFATSPLIQKKSRRSFVCMMPGVYCCPFS